MTREELEKTKWAKEIKEEAPSLYKDIVDVALSPAMKKIEKCDDSWMEEEYLESLRGYWAICSYVYVLAFRPTKKAALALCREMGWKVKR
jgi:hypothetical protein